jgi:hypothetical protein
MVGQHKVDSGEFRELSFGEQEKSIAAAINNLAAAIEYHVEHSPRQLETVEKCLVQIERLGQRLRGTCRSRKPPTDSGRAHLGAEEVPRLHVGSPRLADPGRAADFTLDVAEESPDAGLR